MDLILVFGALLIVASLLIVYGCVVHYEWTKQHLGFVMHWRGGFSASRFAVICGGIFGMVLGVIAVNRSLRFLPESFIAGMGIGALCIIVIAVIHDVVRWVRKNA